MLLTPTWSVPSVLALPMDELRAEGVKGLIFDLDDTLIPHKTGLVPDEITVWLQAIRADGFKAVVVTNNWRADYREQAKAILDLPVFGPAQKPQTKMLKKAIRYLELSPREIVVVGDRPLTDILGGALLGAHTALVDSLSHEKHNGFLRSVLWLERRFIRHQSPAR